jgi:hypothetical protein
MSLATYGFNVDNSGNSVSLNSRTSPELLQTHLGSIALDLLLCNAACQHFAGSARASDEPVNGVVFVRGPMIPKCWNEEAISHAKEVREIYLENPSVGAPLIRTALASYPFYHNIEVVPGIKTAGMANSGSGRVRGFPLHGLPARPDITLRTDQPNFFSIAPVYATPCPSWASGALKQARNLVPWNTMPDFISLGSRMPFRINAGCDARASRR